MLSGGLDRYEVCMTRNFEGRDTFGTRTTRVIKETCMLRAELETFDNIIVHLYL